MIRIITAILLGLGIVAAIWWLPKDSFNILMLVILLIGSIEYGRMFFKDVLERWVTVLSIIITAVVMIFFDNTRTLLPVTLASLLFLLTMLFMWRTSEMKGVAERIGLSTLGILYLGVSFSFWVWLRKMDYGNIAVLFAIAPACLCDTFAYAVGKACGRHKFAPKTSPNKTMEGFAGALVGSMLGVFVIWYFLVPHLEWYLPLGLAFIIWITSPFGDLIESMLKRSCNVKDSGCIIPGHGGVLDRLDALIFTAPAAYLYMKYIFGW